MSKKDKKKKKSKKEYTDTNKKKKSKKKDNKKSKKKNCRDTELYFRRNAMKDISDFSIGEPITVAEIQN